MGGTHRKGRGLNAAAVKHPARDIGGGLSPALSFESSVGDELTNLEIYRDHRKKLIRLRDWFLSRYEAAKDKRKVRDDMVKAEALTSAITLLEHEIGILTAMRSRILDRVGGPGH